jgi:hypothetical protein
MKVCVSQGSRLLHDTSQRNIAPDSDETDTTAPGDPYCRLFTPAHVLPIFQASDD